MNDQSPPKPSRHHIWHIARRTLSKSWDDSIFSESAQAAFWCALSLPPLLLGMLGSLAYIAPLFGPDTLPTIQEQLISTAGRFFSRNVVNEIIAPTVRDIVKGARGEVVSVGFVISLWAGSSAISAFVDSITEAHDQTAAASPGAPTVLRARPVRGDARRGDRDGAVHRTGAAQDRRVPPGQLGQRAGLRLLPGAVPGPGRGDEHPLPGVAARTVAVAPASYRLGAGDRGVPGRHVRAAGVSDVDHQHRLHLRRAGDADRVLVVRVLPRLLDHAGRRAERRDPRGMAGAGHPREAVPVVVGGKGPSHGTAAARSAPCTPAATTTDGDATS